MRLTPAVAAAILAYTQVAFAIPYSPAPENPHSTSISLASAEPSMSIQTAPNGPVPTMPPMGHGPVIDPNEQYPESLSHGSRNGTAGLDPESRKHDGSNRGGRGCKKHGKGCKSWHDKHRHCDKEDDDHEDRKWDQNSHSFPKDAKYPLSDTQGEEDTPPVTTADTQSLPQPTAAAGSDSTEEPTDDTAQDSTEDATLPTATTEAAPAADPTKAPTDAPAPTGTDDTSLPPTATEAADEKRHLGHSEGDNEHRRGPQGGSQSEGRRGEKMRRRAMLAERSLSDKQGGPDGQESQNGQGYTGGYRGPGGQGRPHGPPNRFGGPGGPNRQGPPGENGRPEGGPTSQGPSNEDGESGGLDSQDSFSGSESTPGTDGQGVPSGDGEEVDGQSQPEETPEDSSESNSENMKRSPITYTSPGFQYGNSEGSL